MITQRVGQLSEGDEFTPDNGETWLTVSETFNASTGSPRGRDNIVLVVSISGKRWWGRMDEEVIVKL